MVEPRPKGIPFPPSKSSAQPQRQQHSKQKKRFTKYMSRCLATKVKPHAHIDKQEVGQLCSRVAHSLTRMYPTLVNPVEHEREPYITVLRSGPYILAK